MAMFFPLLPLPAPVAAKSILPGDLASGFGVILFHRGSWCPFCNAQLAAFARAADKFAKEGIKVVSVSVGNRGKVGGARRKVQARRLRRRCTSGFRSHRRLRQ